VDSTTYRFIVVEEPFEWEVPNVFSPNGDGKNEVFRVDAQGVDSFVGRIYNRWGQKLYRWEKVDSGWDGTTFEGKEVPEGTYFFDLRVIDKEGTEHTRRGELTLLR
jgi:gliding motility-associated-like protein